MPIQAAVIATVAQPAMGCSSGQLQTAVTSCCIHLQPAATDKCNRQLQIAAVDACCCCSNQVRAAATHSCSSQVDDKVFWGFLGFFLIEVA